MARVLLADDEAYVLSKLSSRLRSDGHEVLTARDGQAALDLALREHPDLLIADYQMPQLSGIELCQRLRRNPRTAEIPTILLGAAGYGLPTQATRDVIDRRVDKPLAGGDVLASVREVLAARGPQWISATPGCSI